STAPTMIATGSAPNLRLREATRRAAVLSASAPSGIVPVVVNVLPGEIAHSATSRVANGHFRTSRVVIAGHVKTVSVRVRHVRAATSRSAASRVAENPLAASRPADAASPMAGPLAANPPVVNPVAAGPVGVRAASRARLEDRRDADRRGRIPRPRPGRSEIKRYPADHRPDA